MTVSVFIPTTPNYIKYLNSILDAYINDSTVKPDEIVVSISNYKEIDNVLMENLIKKFNHVKFILHENILLAGPNRQCANKYCDSDIIIYQDSDDLPHPQRVEIIKYVFNNYDIVHLNHSYYNLTEEIIKTNKNKLPNSEKIVLCDIKYMGSDELYKIHLPNGKLEECTNITNYYGYGVNYPVHAGAVAIKKDVLKYVMWKNRDELKYSPQWFNRLYKGAEDYEFCVECLKYFNKSMIIDSKIYYYCG